MRHSNLGRFACWAPLGPKKAFDSGARRGPQCNERHVYEPLEGITLRAWHFLVPAVLLLKWGLWNRYIITVYLLCTTREIHRKIFFALIISQAKNQFLPPKHPYQEVSPPSPQFSSIPKTKRPMLSVPNYFSPCLPILLGPRQPSHDKPNTQVCSTPLHTRFDLPPLFLFSSNPCPPPLIIIIHHRHD